MPAVVHPKQEAAWSLQIAIDRFMESNFTDGDLVSHMFLQFALELPVPKTVAEAREAQWVTLDRVEQFKTELLVKHRICLASAPAKGYIVIPPQDQARHAVETTMNAVKKAFRKGGSIIKHTRLDALSDDQRRRHMDAEMKLSAIRSMALKEKRNVLGLFAPKESA